MEITKSVCICKLQGARVPQSTIAGDANAVGSSRSRHYLLLNIAQTVPDTAVLVNAGKKSPMLSGPCIFLVQLA